MNKTEINAMLRELKRDGIGPGDVGPFTITQAAKILDIEPRLTRRYCHEGRLGKIMPTDLQVEYGITTKYVITRKDIVEFGSKHRKVGKPGQIARQMERLNGHK